MMLYRVVTATLIAALLAGCVTLGPDYRRQKIDAPDAWPTPATAASVPTAWWRGYQDPALEAMVDEALRHNADLRLAIARVDEARAGLGVARADQWPGGSANGSASRSRASEDSALAVPGADPIHNNVRATLDASYEIDFWGKYRRATEAAQAELLATEFNRDAVRLALIVEVSQGYFNLRALDAQVAITTRTVSTRVDSLALQRQRFEAGVASELELRQVEAEAAAAQALLPVLEIQLAVLVRSV
jgi:multidrug efflux system outer membrane protein